MCFCLESALLIRVSSRFHEIRLLIEIDFFFLSVRVFAFNEISSLAQTKCATHISIIIWFSVCWMLWLSLQMFVTECGRIIGLLLRKREREKMTFEWVIFVCVCYDFNTLSYALFLFHSVLSMYFAIFSERITTLLSLACCVNYSKRREKERTFKCTLIQFDISQKLSFFSCNHYLCQIFVTVALKLLELSSEFDWNRVFCAVDKI